MANRVPTPTIDTAAEFHKTARERRRLLIAMALRRQRPGTGSALGFSRERSVMQVWPDLRRLLDGIRWAVAGGVATRAFMPERMTEDLDIVVHPADLNELLTRLAKAGYQLGAELSVPGRMVEAPDGTPLDVLEGRFGWIDEALAGRAQDPAGLPVLDLPYLVLMKLAASRTIDLGDIARMLGLASAAQLAAVRDVVARFTPEDAEDLESLIALGRLEQGRKPE